MNIRKSDPADLSDILEMRLALFEETGEVMSPAERAEVLRANEAFFVRSAAQCETWVAEDGGQLVGVGTLAFFFRPPYPGNLAGKEAYLLNMYTRPGHRGRGIAKAILAEALACASQNGFAKVWLHATDAGRPIYEAAGFSAQASYMERVASDA